MTTESQEVTVEKFEVGVETSTGHSGGGCWVNSRDGWWTGSRSRDKFGRCARVPRETRRGEGKDQRRSPDRGGTGPLRDTVSRLILLPLDFRHVLIYKFDF